MGKNERQVNSNLPCQFDHFWRNLNFWSGRAVWLRLRPSFFFSSLRIFYVKMATSEEGGVCITLIVNGYRHLWDEHTNVIILNFKNCENIRNNLYSGYNSNC